MKITNDAGLSELISSSEESLLCTGFAFTEGPIWIENDNSLLFSDINKQTIHQWQQITGRVDSYRPSSHHSNGLTLDLRELGIFLHVSIQDDEYPELPISKKIKSRQ